MKKYWKKCDESFKTKLNIFLFTKCLNNININFTKDEFHNYKIEEKDIKIYAGIYLQWEEHQSCSKLKERSPNNINSMIEKWKNNNREINSELKKEYRERFKNVLSDDIFKKVYDSEECYYCHIKIGDIFDLSDPDSPKLFKKNRRGYSMEIDRKHPYEEYHNLNIVPCCYWCNSAKTDEFTAEEFQPIADQIRLVWEKRLGREIKK